MKDTFWYILLLCLVILTRLQFISISLFSSSLVKIVQCYNNGCPENSPLVNFPRSIPNRWIPPCEFSPGKLPRWIPTWWIPTWWNPTWWIPTWWIPTHIFQHVLCTRRCIQSKSKKIKAFFTQFFIRTSAYFWICLWP